MLQSQTHWAGGFEQQRSRPPPAAETGRRGWGSAPLFQSPAKGLQKKRQAQLVRPAEWSGGQKSPCATATTTASGRSREELLGLRPAGCACRPRHDAAAGSRDPGSFLFCAARDIHPRPPKKPQRITLHSPFPVSSLPQGRLALQGNKKDALRSLAKRLCL